MIIIGLYSWNEIGIYNIPAIYRSHYRANKAGEDLCVTHSQGGTVFFVMANERPEYQEKVIAHFTLALGAFVSRAGMSVFVCCAF